MCKGFWTGVAEFLANLVGETFHPVIIKFRRQRRSFMTLKLIDLILLTLNIALIFGLNLYLFGHGFVVYVTAFHTGERGNIGIRQLRAFQQIA